MDGQGVTFRMEKQSTPPVPKRGTSGMSLLGVFRLRTRPQYAEKRRGGVVGVVSRKRTFPRTQKDPSSTPYSHILLRLPVQVRRTESLI